jgi:hypothetical protein
MSEDSESSDDDVQLVWVVLRHDAGVVDALEAVDVFVHPSKKLAEEWACHWNDDDDRYIAQVYKPVVIDTSPPKVSETKAL